MLLLSLGGKLRLAAEKLKCFIAAATCGGLTKQSRPNKATTSLRDIVAAFMT